MIVGALGGYFGGWVDDALQRVTDIIQTMPSFVLLVVLVAIVQPSVQGVTAGIAIVTWPTVARLVRAEFRSLREKDFVMAARALGFGHTRIILREILPNALPPLIVTASVLVASAILMESALSFSLEEGRCLAIVGESGSGKSVTARSLVGLTGRGASLRADRHIFDGHDVTGWSDRAWSRVRGNQIGFVLQDALVSLDQLLPVGRAIGEGLRLHGKAGTKALLTEQVIELLKLVGVPDPAAKARQLPHELSGGQRQRALIAAALALDPKLLIADEPTTALDVAVQAQILALLEATQARGKAPILISHNLAVVSRMADDVIVMRRGGGRGKRHRRAGLR